MADWLTKEGDPGHLQGRRREGPHAGEARTGKDVIDALKKHEIGYHSNFHSVQPTPAMYLSALGWDEGVAEFDRREKPGYDDVKRIFGQAPDLLRPAGQFVGAAVVTGRCGSGRCRCTSTPAGTSALDGKPHYYGGVFTVYQLTHTLRTDLGGEKDAGEGRGPVRRGAQEAAGRGRRGRQHLLPPVRVRPQAVLGRGRTSARGPTRRARSGKLPAAKTEEESKRRLRHVLRATSGS